MDFYKFKASYGYAVNQISEAQQAYVHGGPHKRDFGAAEVLLFGELFIYGKFFWRTQQCVTGVRKQVRNNWRFRVERDQLYVILTQKVVEGHKLTSFQWEK